MKILHMVTFILVVAGAINLGLSALGLDVLYKILGSVPTVEKIVYVLVGLSGVYMIFDHMKSCKMCEGKKLGT